MEKNGSMIKLRRWARIIEAANASNLSRSEWCKKMGVTENAFYYWQRRVREYVLNQIPDRNESAGNTSSSVSVSEAPVSSPDFFEIVIPESSAVSDTSSKTEDSVSLLSQADSSTDTVADKSGITIRCGSFSIDVSEGFSKNTFQSVLEVIAHV